MDREGEVAARDYLSKNKDITFGKLSYSFCIGFGQVFRHKTALPEEITDYEICTNDQGAQNSGRVVSAVISYNTMFLMLTVQAKVFTVCA